MFAIYQLTNIINNKSYIGFTTKNPPTLRWAAHQWDAANRYRNRLFHNAIRKYGAENFTFSILEEGWNPVVGLHIREPFWISVLKPEYNTTPGGEGGKTLGNTGKVSSAETRAKIGLKSKGRKLSLEVRDKLSSMRRGRHHSPEHCAAIRAGKIGKKRGPYKMKVKS